MNSNFFNQIEYLETVDSTNLYLKNSDKPDKSIIYTFNQTSGKGRNQKKWNDFSNKNLAISFILKSQKIMKNPVWYIATCSLALINVVKQLNISNYWIKWPNDVYINKNKLAGVLAESIWIGNKIDKSIIGIGININCSAQDLSILDNDATSIYLETGKIFNLHDFFYNYKCELEKFLDLLINKNNLNSIKEHWLKNCKIIGKKVEWSYGKMKSNGTPVDIDTDGSLLLNINNEIVKVSSGDVKVLDY